MKIDLSRSLTCKKGHSYDLSKKGTINSLRNACKLIYSKELFEARNAVCEAGFYDPLLEELVEVISRHQQKINRKVNVLDIGCKGSKLSFYYRKRNGQFICSNDSTDLGERSK